MPITIIVVQGRAKSGKTRLLLQTVEEILLSKGTHPQVIELREILNRELSRPKVLVWEE